jgi:hypothetical protein
MVPAPRKNHCGSLKGSWVNHLRTAPGLAPTPSLSYSEPPVSPTPINARPVAYQPVVPIAPPPPTRLPVQPPAAVQPPAPAPPPPAPAVDQSVAVFLHLSSGERLWVGRYDTEALAVQRAEQIVRTLVRPEPGVWAKFGQRLIRPEAVVSIELANRRED